MKNSCRVVECGIVPFGQALAWQNLLYDKRLRSEITDTFLLLQHPHTYTLGRRSKESHLLLDGESIQARGIDLCEADRGGSVTYHGPGQLVGYSIMDLRPAPDISSFVRNLEEVIILTAKSFGVECGRSPGLPGVWTNGSKLASIGLKVTRGVTKHGFSLNAETELGYFEGIVPCGIDGVSMTSLSKESKKTVSVRETSEKLKTFFSRVFATNLEKCELADLGLK